MKKLSKGSIAKIVFYVLTLAIVLLPASSANAEAKQKPQASAAAETKINAEQEKEKAKFCYAVYNDSYDSVKEFLEAGQDPNNCPKEDCKNYSTYMLKNYLLPYGFNLNTCDIDDMVSKFNLKEADFAKELVMKYGAKPSLVNVSDLATAEFMYEKGAEITDEAIEEAILNRKTEIFKFFISKDDKTIEKAWKLVIENYPLLDDEDFVYSFEPDLEKIRQNTDDKQLKEYLYAEIEKRIEMKIQEEPDENKREELREQGYQKIDARNKEVYDTVEAKDLERLKKALENGGSANTCKGCIDYSHKYPRFCPAKSENGYNLECGTSAFEVALKEKNYDIMKVLIENGLEPDGIIYEDEVGEGSDYSLTELIIEVVNESKDVELADFLIGNGMYPLYYNTNKVSLHLQLNSFDNTAESKEFLTHLLERGLSPATIDSFEFLQRFMYDKPFVEYLLSKGVKPDLCYMKNIEDFKWMLSKGGNLNGGECRISCESESSCDYGPLIDSYAGMHKNIDIFKFLLENGAEITERTKNFANWYPDAKEVAEYIKSLSKQEEQENKN
ncbi:MAG: hypothetical protein LBL61_06875 [Elusimicrobiota bacterium]|jgi:ankyrin repeat protein|nr:hypothetical protein [Elusimicrobiota bacterium]